MAPPEWPSKGPPNLVARTISSRRAPNACPRYSSLLVFPYMSAVSKKVMPASRAAPTTASDSLRSMSMPKLLHPSPTSLTVSEPIVRVSMT